jgi:hypothetical protein
MVPVVGLSRAHQVGETEADQADRVRDFQILFLLLIDIQRR